MTQFGVQPRANGSKFFPQTLPVVKAKIPPPRQPKKMVRRLIPLAPVQTTRIVGADWYLTNMTRGVWQREKERSICEEVCAKHNVTMPQLMGQRRCAEFVDARWEVAWRLDRELGYSLPMIGKVLSKDHTTVINMLRRYQARLDALKEAEAADV